MLAVRSAAVFATVANTRSKPQKPQTSGKWGRGATLSILLLAFCATVTTRRFCVQERTPHSCVHSCLVFFHESRQRLIPVSIVGIWPTPIVQPRVPPVHEEALRPTPLVVGHSLGHSLPYPCDTRSFLFLLPFLLPFQVFKVFKVPNLVHFTTMGVLFI